MVETDDDGRIAPATHLVFPIVLANRHRSLRCQPGERPSGFLRGSTHAGSDQLDGRFQVKLPRCENAETGQDIEWPAGALAVSGSFRGAPSDRRQTPCGTP